MQQNATQKGKLPLRQNNLLDKQNMQYQTPFPIQPRLFLK